MRIAFVTLTIIIPNLAIAQLFNIRESTITTDAVVWSVADWRGKPFCLQAGGVMFAVDTATLDVTRYPVSVHRLTELFSKGDTLYGVTYEDSLYLFDGRDFRYTGRKREKLLYIDANYKVTGSCSGEWGGSVFFFNKQSHKLFAAGATCPVMVNKTKEGYVVTATLAHLSGSTEILEIPFPDKMEVYKFDPPKGKVIYVGDDESRSRQGVRVMVDSISVMAIGSFLVEGELLHVVTKEQQTFICRITKGAFETVQRVSGLSLWSYNPVSWYGEDGAGWSFFNNDKCNGVLRIAGRNIHIYYFSR